MKLQRCVEAARDVDNGAGRFRFLPPALRLVVARTPCGDAGLGRVRFKGSPTQMRAPHACRGLVWRGDVHATLPVSCISSTTLLPHVRAAGF